VAERLVGNDHRQLASVRQGRGIAYRANGDGPAAPAAFQEAMRTYALAGDAIHVNNSRYMMAAAAVAPPEHATIARAWAEQCAAYARETGNRQELAHALLTTAALAGGDLTEAVDIFRAAGELRCLTCGYLLLADGHPDPAPLRWTSRARPTTSPTGRSRWSGWSTRTGPRPSTGGRASHWGS
jgi:hypothetical protein